MEDLQISPRRFKVIKMDDPNSSLRKEILKLSNDLAELVQFQTSVLPYEEKLNKTYNELCINIDNLDKSNKKLEKQIQLLKEAQSDNMPVHEQMEKMIEEINALEQRIPILIEKKRLIDQEKNNKVLNESGLQ